MPYKDPEKQRDAQHLHYLANKEVYKKRANEHRLRARASDREWLRLQKEGKSCLYCGEPDARCLHYHHREPPEKRYDVSEMVYHGQRKSRIIEEIAKCDLVCANCHLKIHSAGGI